MSSHDTIAPTTVSPYSAEDTYPKYHLSVVVASAPDARAKPLLIQGPHTVPLGTRAFESLTVTRLAQIDGAPHLQLELK
jgi:hypothetical protein